MLAIYKRELKAYFISPIGYVFMGVFLLIYGFFFANVCIGYRQATVVGEYAGVGVLSGSIVSFLFLVPVLTMRLLSEERGSKTDQILLTSPVKVPEIVLGKYLAAATVFVGTLALTFLHLGVIEKYADLPWAETIGGYVAFLMSGLAFIAIGMFISSLTESQVVSAIATFGVLLMLFSLNDALINVNIPVLDSILSWFAMTRWFSYFTMGIFSIPAIVYYITIIGVFLFLTVRQIERRRWN